MHMFFIQIHGIDNLIFSVHSLKQSDIGAQPYYLHQNREHPTTQDSEVDKIPVLLLQIALQLQ